MPPQVTSKQEEVVGLTSMACQEFRDHVVHAVERYWKGKKKLADQQEELKPLLDEDKKVLFVDGSCYRDYGGNHARFAVVQQEQSQFQMIKLEACPQPCSAQLAELKALTAACELMEVCLAVRQSPVVPMDSGPTPSSAKVPTLYYYDLLSVEVLKPCPDEDA
ncbi:hypothetical protein chiPu_0007318 [Chiloscyllium punctatum]|uniref:RNase H type-1 domain-containing protein n=1 Tax=Chiloscyllium punctatum TaxID=137246 RepID=A0A401SEU9_CHIPU|nr:hypothetical protein [Chiloscyllium punctatum]